MLTFTEPIKTVFGLFKCKNEIIFVYYKYVICQFLLIFRFYKRRNMTKTSIYGYPLSQINKLGSMMHRICINVDCFIIQPQRQEGCQREGDQESLILLCVWSQWIQGYINKGHLNPTLLWHETTPFKIHQTKLQSLTNI